MHGDFNAADKTANALVSVPVPPVVRGQEGPSPSTPEKLTERGPRQGVAHARVELEREPKARVAPRENEVIQQ